jgi:hypothetical protein
MGSPIPIAIIVLTLIITLLPQLCLSAPTDYLLHQKQRSKDICNSTGWGVMKYLFILTLLLITGCSGVDVSTYRNNNPTFDLYSYFHGEVKGWGVVQDRKQELLRQFVVDIQGEINTEGNLVLREHFSWNDGEKTTRVWTIAKEGQGRFTGRADDVIGTAAGVVAGNALHWTYTVNLEVEGTTWKIDFDDWMFLQPDDVLVNRATMRKFGLRVGEVTIFFQKQTSGGA